MTEHSKHVTVYVPSLVRRREIGSIRVVTTMPLDWMVRGFAGAVERFRNAEERQGSDVPATAEVASIALFEASTWLDSITAKVRGLRDDPYVRAFRFVRQRCHHHWASVVFFDRDRRAYLWSSEGNVPIPEKEQHRNPRGEQAYTELFARRPVGAVLGYLEKLVAELPSDANRGLRSLTAASAAPSKASSNARSCSSASGARCP
jgi:hypothetical protein